MRGYANGAGFEAEAVDAWIAEVEARAAASLSLVLSGPQAARVDAVAQVAGVAVRSELVLAGRCFSARRERVSILRADVELLARGLRLVAAGQPTVRARAEWLATAEALENAAAPASEAA